MTYGPGYEPAQPPDPREQPGTGGEQAAPPSGFSFPDGANPPGPPGPFSFPDDSQPPSGPYGQPPAAPQYGTPQPPDYRTPGPSGSPYGQQQPGYGNPWGSENAAPTSGYGSPYQPDPGVPGAPVSGPDPSGGFPGDFGAAAPAPTGFGPRSGPKEQLAIVAMGIGLVATAMALIGCCTVIPRILALLAGVGGVVLGIIAQQKISSSGGRLAGTPQAVIGIASGGVAIFLALLTIVVTFLN